MKKVEYKCNLCDRVEPKAKSKDVFKAMYWKSDKMPQGYVLTDNLDCCDRHICVNCISLINKY